MEITKVSVMKSLKYKLVVIALLGTLISSTSSTLSLFANDHAFYNESAPCIKCHGDIQLQLEDTGRVTTLHRTQDLEYGCLSCHANSNNTLGRNVTDDYHSAYSPYCIECHDKTSSIYGTQEAHTIIVTGANSSKLKLGINEACAMCHTTLFDSVTVRNREVFAFENDSIAVNGTPEYNGSYTITFDNPQSSGLHNYNSGVQCIMCHAPIYLTLSQASEPYNKHSEFGCEGCHRGSGADIDNIAEPQVEYHAAKTKFCSDCHGLVDYPRDCNQCHESHGGFKPGV